MIHLRLSRLLGILAMMSVPLIAWPIQAGAPAKADATETVVEFHVQPMAAPHPALKYQLLPELMEMEPGNPIQGYLKSFMEQHNFFFNQASVQKREKWQEMPLKELPTGPGRSRCSLADARLADPPASQARGIQPTFARRAATSHAGVRPQSALPHGNRRGSL